MPMERLLELEKKINGYMEEVTADNVIDTDEIVQLANYAKEIVNEIDEDRFETDEEKEVYDRVSTKLKELFRNYEIQGD